MSASFNSSVGACSWMVRNSAGGVRKGLYLVTERADRGGVFSLTYYELLTCQKKRKPKKGIMRPFAIFILLVFFLCYIQGLSATLGFKDFIGSFEVKTFSGSIV